MNRLRREIKGFPPVLWLEVDNEEPPETPVDFASGLKPASRAEYQYRARLNGSSRCLSSEDIFGSKPQKALKRDVQYSQLTSIATKACCSLECLRNDFLVHKERACCIRTCVCKTRCSHNIDIQDMHTHLDSCVGIYYKCKINIYSICCAFSCQMLPCVIANLRVTEC